MNSNINNQYVWAETKKPYDGNRANTGAYLLEGKIELATTKANDSSKTKIININFTSYTGNS